MKATRGAPKTTARKNDLELLRPYLADIRQGMGVAADDDSMDHVIAQLDPHDLLEKYLHWEGIRGYTLAVVRILSATPAGEGLRRG